MKKFLVLYLTVVAALSGCKKDNCTPEQNIAVFGKDRAITTYYYQADDYRFYSVHSGENLVFRYSHTRAECEDVLDDEYGFNFDFEIDKAADKFRFEGSELALTKGVVLEFGAWVSNQYQNIGSGLIEGSKISANQWRVKADVTTTPLRPDQQPKRITFDRVFTLEQ
ncbi:hypothetical protein [Pontibacter roseus]|uniref:hypothetical protein n=1 Tax=Pontibacter roseus TaxID=336989 RepID=UPI00037B1E16|nr:hypothetical protein [Pontibacter roseus]